MSGWYLMHRGWQENPVFDGEPYGERDAWLWLIEKAVWRDTVANVKGSPIPLKRGQLSFSVRYLADAWDWHKNKVTRFLEKLKKWDMIVSESGTGQQIITICNYDKYQTDGDSSGTAANQKAGQDGDSSGTNKKENKTSKKNKSITPIPAWVPEQPWKDFVEMRKRIEEPMTERAVQLNISEFEKLVTQGHDPTEIINSSVIHNWKSFYPPKAKKNETTRRMPTHSERLKAAGDEAVREILSGYSSQSLAITGPDHPEL